MRKRIITTVTAVGLGLVISGINAASAAAGYYSGV